LGSGVSVISRNSPLIVVSDDYFLFIFVESVEFMTVIDNVRSTFEASVFEDGGSVGLEINYTKEHRFMFELVIRI